MANPMYLLQPAASLTGELQARREASKARAMFKPTILSTDDLQRELGVFAERHKTIDVSKLVFDYMYSVGMLDKASAFDHLVKLYQFKTYLVKALLETVIFLTGDSELRIVNSIFEHSSEDMSAETAILCTRLMLDATKHSSFTVYALLKNRDKWPDVPTMNIQQEVDMSGMHPSLVKLSYCSVKYWNFPRYVREVSKEGHRKLLVKRSILWVAPFPKIEPSDIKLARLMTDTSI